LIRAAPGAPLRGAALHSIRLVVKTV
jgi:hypothetical protein